MLEQIRKKERNNFIMGIIFVSVILLIISSTFWNGSENNIQTHNNIIQQDYSRLLEESKPINKSEPLLKQMKKIYKQKEVIYKDMKEKIEFKLKPKMEKFNQTKTKIKEAMKNFKKETSQLLQLFNISEEKANELKKFDSEIQEMQRQRDFRFHFYSAYRGRIQPLCPARTKIVGLNQIQFPDSSQLIAYNRVKDLIIITYNPQKIFLQILYKHLSKQKQQFYEWHLWLDNNDNQNIKYMQKLQKQNTWVKITRLQKLYSDQAKNLPYFWLKDCEANKIYLRIDRSIAWISDNFVSKMFEARIANPNHILVYGNIINNGLIDHIHQNSGNFNFSEVAHHHCEGTGWETVQFVKNIHEQFLDSVEKNTTSKWAKSFRKWIALDYEKISFNAVIYFGKTILSIQGPLNIEEEQLYAVDYPNSYGIPNIVTGQAIGVNYAYYYQKDYLNSFPQILKKYRSLAEL